MSKQRLDIEISGNDSKFGAAADRTMARLNKIGGAVQRMAGLLGVGLGLAGFRSLTTSVTQVNMLARSINVSSEALQKFAIAASESGVEMQVVADAIKDLRKSQGEALTGDTRKADIFASFGVSLKELKSMNPEQLFRRVAEEASKMSGSSEEFADAVRIMGESGGRVLGAMQNDLIGVADSARTAAGVISEELGGELEYLNNRINELGRNGKGFFARLGVAAADVAGMALTGFSNVAYAAFGKGSAEERAAAAMERGKEILDFFGVVQQPTPKEYTPWKRYVSPPPTESNGNRNSAASIGGFGIPTADALARIGLFRGGTSQIERQKVNLLQQIASNTSRTAAAMNEEL